ncbi:MAG: hypothetical protein Fur0041_17800 [Bacteroidia bacterium]
MSKTYTLRTSAAPVPVKIGSVFLLIFMFNFTSPDVPITYLIPLFFLSLCICVFLAKEVKVLDFESCKAYMKINLTGEKVWQTFSIKEFDILYIRDLEAKRRIRGRRYNHQDTFTAYEVFLGNGRRRYVIFAARI